jgi:hypothetical protein
MKKYWSSASTMAGGVVYWTPELYDQFREDSKKYLEAVEKENLRKYEARQFRHIILD